MLSVKRLAEEKCHQFATAELAQTEVMIKKKKKKKKKKKINYKMRKCTFGQIRPVKAVHLCCLIRFFAAGDICTENTLMKLPCLS